MGLDALNIDAVFDDLYLIIPILLAGCVRSQVSLTSPMLSESFDTVEGGKLGFRDRVMTWPLRDQVGADC